MQKGTNKQELTRQNPELPLSKNTCKNCEKLTLFCSYLYRIFRVSMALIMDCMAVKMF